MVNWIESERDYIEKSDEEHYDVLHFLKQGISQWISSETMQKMVGKAENNYERTPCPDNPSNMVTTKFLQTAMCVETTEQGINTILAQWGYDVVRITGDGNCFLDQLHFNYRSCERVWITGRLGKHLYSLSIITRGASFWHGNILRKHLVDEWTGLFTEEYQQAH